MSVPSNILKQVETYNLANMALLQNSYAFISNANKKFKNFENIPGQLGQTVTFDSPPRFTSTKSLVATFESSEQRINTLTVDQPVSAAFAFSAEQFVYNVEDYVRIFARSAVAEIGANIEEAGAAQALNTYRFYTAGVTSGVVQPINSHQQLAQAIAQYRSAGAAQTDFAGFIPDVSVPAIVGSGLTEFVTQRNEKEAMSWKLGMFSECYWNRSNLLSRHIAGTIGNQTTDAGRTLTVVSTNDPTGANITQITCTTPVTDDANAIKANDVAQFVDNISGLSDVRFLTWIGHKNSSAPCQIRITADAASSAGTVVINIDPGLVAQPGKNQNISANIVAGMKIIVMPSHTAGLIMCGNPLYMAMPQLPDQVPYPTANQIDTETGVSLRMTYGSRFAENFMGNVIDAIYGWKLIPEYAQRLLFPLY